MAFCRAFAIVNLAFAAAWINVIRGRKFASWTSRRPGVAPATDMVDSSGAGHRDSVT
jgi:hypothetical protein